MNRWVRHPLRCALAEHAPAWDALLARMGYANPMLQSNFVDSALAHFGDGSEVLFVLERDAGAEAMAILKPGKFGVWTTFLPGQVQIGPVLVREMGVFHSIFTCLPGWVGQVDLLSLDPCFGGAGKTNHRLHGVVDHNLTIAVCTAGRIDGYWAGRSKNLVKNIRRYAHRIERSGKALDFRVHQALEDILPALARYCVLEAAGWKAKEGTALAPGNEQHRFYDALLTRFSATGDAVIEELWLGNALIASRLCIRHGKTLVILKTTHDESARSFAPARQLLLALIEREFATNSGGVIEFYTHATEDQLAWATGQRWISHHAFFRNEPFRALADAGRPLLRRVKGPQRAVAAGTDLRVESFSGIGALPEAALEAMRQAEAANFEQGPDWYRNLIRTVFNDDPGIRIYVLSCGERVEAVLPVRVIRDRGAARIEALGNFYTSLYQPYFSEHLSAEALALLIGELVSKNAPVSGFHFSPMDVGGHGFRLLAQALKKTGLAVFSYFCFGNWYLKAGVGWETYLLSRSRQMRSTLKRASKRFSDEGGVLEIVDGGAVLASAITEFQHVYSNSWKNDEPYPGFMPGLIRLLAARGALRLCIARLGGQAIGAQLWIVANGKASIFKVAYHEAYKKYSVGHLVGSALTEHALDVDGVQEIDFLIGDDPYKASWMSDRRERWGIVAYNLRTWKGILGFGREALGRLLKPWVMKMTRRRGKCDD